VKAIEEVIRSGGEERMPIGRPKVYLAGPIENCTDAEAGEWREYATVELNKIGYDVLDPFRRDYRGVADKYYKEIVEEDKKEIRETDYIIANCFKPSAGTSMEIFMAWDIGKPAIVVVSGPTNPWIKYHAREAVETLEDAFAVLKKLSAPERAGRIR